VSTGIVYARLGFRSFRCLAQILGLAKLHYQPFILEKRAGTDDFGASEIFLVDFSKNTLFKK
jgi:hypothetical protein